MRLENTELKHRLRLMQSRSAKTSKAPEMAIDSSGTAYYRLKRELETVKKQLAEVSGAYSSLRRQVRQQTPPMRDRPRDPPFYSRGNSFLDRSSQPSYTTRRAYESSSYLSHRRALSDTEDRWGGIGRRRGLVPERTVSPHREPTASPRRRFDPTAYQKQRREAMERGKFDAAIQRTHSRSTSRNESGYASASSQVDSFIFWSIYLKLLVVRGFTITRFRCKQKI